MSASELARRKKGSAHRGAAGRSLDRILAGDDPVALLAWFQKHPDVRFGRRRSAPWLSRASGFLGRVAKGEGKNRLPVHLQKKVLTAFTSRGAGAHEVGRNDSNKPVPVLVRVADIASPSVLRWFLKSQGPFARSHAGAAFRQAVEYLRPVHARMLLDAGARSTGWLDALLYGHDRVARFRDIGLIDERTQKAQRRRAEETLAMLEAAGVPWPVHRRFAAHHVDSVPVEKRLHALWLGRSLAAGLPASLTLARKRL